MNANLDPFLAMAALQAVTRDRKTPAWDALGQAYGQVYDQLVVAPVRWLAGVLQPAKAGLPPAEPDAAVRNAAPGQTGFELPASAGRANPSIPGRRRSFRRRAGRTVGQMPLPWDVRPELQPVLWIERTPEASLSPAPAWRAAEGAPDYSLNGCSKKT